MYRRWGYGLALRCPVAKVPDWQAKEEVRKMQYVSSVQRIGRQEGFREGLQQGLDSERPGAARPPKFKESLGTLRNIHD